MTMPTKEEIDSMRESLKVFGTKSEAYYDKLNTAEVLREYDRMTKRGDLYDW